MKVQNITKALKLSGINREGIAMLVKNRNHFFMNQQARAFSDFDKDIVHEQVVVKKIVEPQDREQRQRRDRDRDGNRNNNTDQNKRKAYTNNSTSQGNRRQFQQIKVEGAIDNQGSNSRIRELQQNCQGVQLNKAQEEILQYLQRNKVMLASWELPKVIKIYCIQLAKQRPSELNKKFQNFISMRQNHHEILEIVEKNIEKCDLSEWVQITHLYNINRLMKRDEGAHYRKFKDAVQQRNKQFFNNPEYVDQVKALDFKYLCQILTHTYSLYVETPLIHEIEARLNNWNPEQKLDLEVICKLALEARESNNGMAALHKILQNLTSVLKENDILNNEPASICVKLLSAYSYLQKQVHRDYKILDRLLIVIRNKVNEVQENDVLILTEAYKYLPTSTPFVNKFYTDIQEIILQQALESDINQIQTDFLVQYIGQLLECKQAKYLPQQMLNSYQALVENKLKQSFNLPAKSIKHLGQIAEFFQDSKIIRDFLIQQCHAQFENLQYENIQLMLKQTKLQDPENYLANELNVIFYCQPILIQIAEKIKAIQKNDVLKHSYMIQQLFLLSQMESYTTHHQEYTNALLQKIVEGIKLVDKTSFGRLIYYYRDLPFLDTYFSGDSLLNFTRNNYHSDLFFILAMQKPRDEILFHKYFDPIKAKFIDLSFGKLMSFISKYLDLNVKTSQLNNAFLKVLLKNTQYLHKIVPGQIYDIVDSIFESDFNLQKSSQGPNHIIYQNISLVCELLGILDEKLFKPASRYLLTLKRCSVYMLQPPEFFIKGIQQRLRQESHQELEKSNFVELVGLMATGLEHLQDVKIQINIIRFMKKHFSWEKINQDIQNNLTTEKIGYMVASYRYVLSLIEENDRSRSLSEGSDLVGIFNNLNWKSIQGLVMQQFNQDIQDKNYGQAINLLSSVMLFDNSIIKNIITQLSQDIQAIIDSISVEDLYEKIIRIGYFSSMSSNLLAEQLLNKVFNKIQVDLANGKLNTIQVLKLQRLYAQFAPNNQESQWAFDDEVRRIQQKLCPEEDQYQKLTKQLLVLKQLKARK
ncbi:UNKNOWN [Stylonychia lemnae]|uniref:Uncharacterized protein n=1 Tax=Stylonychia lemnae TaxID=5949 RepID=A0A078AQ25_STYLE|nr:UNKNOWN [Stylonychia lemnae]|eukprot:CDW84470.1 UNKNOWN [Stylonychia lemnae]